MQHCKTQHTTTGNVQTGLRGGRETGCRNRLHHWEEGAYRTRPERDDQEVLEALGWEFRRDDRCIMPKRRRVWRLWLALFHALERRQGSGRQLSRLVGHFVSMAALVKRETLCCLNAVYAFVAKHPEDSAAFWPSVLRELRWMQSLLPLLVHDLAKPFSTRVLACDASMWGKGVVHKDLPSETVRELARFSERWRYHGAAGSARGP